MALRVFGLTGGIGSGKSAVAARLRARGLPVVNADELSRAVVLPGSETLARVVSYFGGEILEVSGALDRVRLGGIVFAEHLDKNQMADKIANLVAEAERQGN